MASNVCFSLQSKDRPDFTSQSIYSILAADGFDLICCDGSTHAATPQLLCRVQQEFPYRVRSIECSVTGGPDAAIQHALKCQLDLNYDYIGLIENDVVCRSRWFDALMHTIFIAKQDGLAVGAASIRGYQSRVLEYRNGYSIDWATGAGMVLFTRAAAKLILDHYSELQMSVGEIYQFYADRFHRRIISPEWLFAPGLGKVTFDFGYSPFLYKHDLYSVGSIPSFAYDLQFDVRDYLNTSYVTRAQNASGSPYALLE